MIGTERRARRAKFRYHARERRIHDGDLGALTDKIVEMNDVARTHSDAAVAGRVADVSFFGGAVNVNHAAIGVRVLWLEAAQPNDACDDRVAPGRVGRDDFTGASSIFKHGADGCAVPDLLGNREASKGCAITSASITDAKLRGRNGISRKQSTLLKQGKLLIADADQDLMLAVGCCA